MAYKVDDNVKLKFSTLQGVVKGASLDNTTLEIQYLVEYNDTEGEAQTRYFKDAELESL